MPTSAAAAGLHLPRYAELPRVELYMDQVLLLVEEAATACGERPLTAHMINNYVKQGLLPPPRKKRYTRQQLASLLLICLLKNLLPIADIKLLLQTAAAGEEDALAQFYDRFCELLEPALAQPLARPAAPPAEQLAQLAAQALAHKYYLQKYLQDEPHTPKEE